jgi:hypothetical protein
MSLNTDLHGFTFYALWRHFVVYADSRGLSEGDLGVSLGIPMEYLKPRAALQVLGAGLVVVTAIAVPGLRFGPCGLSVSPTHAQVFLRYIS